MDRIDCPNCKEYAWVFFTCEEEVRNHKCLDCGQPIDILKVKDEESSNENTELQEVQSAQEQN